MGRWLGWGGRVVAGSGRSVQIARRECNNIFFSFVRLAQLVERPLSEREVVGSNPGRTIPKV